MMHGLAPELWGLYHGQRIAWGICDFQLQVESCSEFYTELILGENCICSSCSEFLGGRKLRMFVATLFYSFFF